MQFVSKGTDADPQHFGSLGPILIHMGQGLFNQMLFQFFDGHTNERGLIGNLSILGSFQMQIRGRNESIPDKTTGSHPAGRVGNRGLSSCRRGLADVALRRPANGCLG